MEISLKQLYKNNDPIEKKVSALMEQMTLDEKIAQLGSCWFYELQSNGKLDMQKVQKRFSNGIGQITRLTCTSILPPVQAAQTANLLQKVLMEQTRLGIPAIFHEECCSGSIALGATIFPQSIGLASTFQPELALQMATEIQKQLRAIGVHQGLAPELDVARDPRWGRIEETFGEDPLLISQFGMQYTRGLQGADFHHGIIATGKHFVGHSLSQGGLNCAPVQVGKRTLWETYLMPFQAAIRDAGLASIMNAYPELDGEVAAASKNLLTDLLRNQLGFQGLVVSDYEAIIMLHTYHRMASSWAEAAAAAMNAGIDVELPTTKCYAEDLIHQIEAGIVHMERIDQAVANHLTMKFKLGLFENPFVDEGKVLEVFETQQQRDLAKNIAAKGMVLLTNNGILPLSKNIKTIAVIGPNADDERNLCGAYSYVGMIDNWIYSKIPDSSFINLDRDSLIKDQPIVITPLNAIKEKLPNSKILYAKGCDVNSQDRSGFPSAIQAAQKADAVILILGDRSGMIPDCTCGETRDSADLKLPGVQTDLAEAIFTVGKPAVVVLINGRPLAIPDIVKRADAILEAWIPGEEGGTAIADILFGDQNPGGKLPITFPRSVGQVPIFYNNKPAGMKSNWHIDYVSESVKPLFPFGHGLSYSHFRYSDFFIDKPQAGMDETVVISCTVENIGSIAGDEVVQLYICDEYGSIPRPVKELKGFQRISLAAGESRTIHFLLPVNMLAFYDENFDLVIEPGRILVMIGSSSEDIRMQGAFEITGDRKMMIYERIFICPTKVES